MRDTSEGTRQVSCHNSHNSHNSHDVSLATQQPRTGLVCKDGAVCMNWWWP